MPAASPRPLVRVLAAAWLLLAAVLVLGLLGELWLRLERRADYAATARFNARNVFFANLAELNAGNHSLWTRRWREYRPGARVELDVGGQHFVVEINSRGYRTHEFEVPKPAGRLRVVCIGGSTTVAGRTNAETWPALVEAGLRARHPGLGIEVLDLGISALTTHDWADRLEEVFGYGPDLVVQYQAINDISWRQLPRYASEHSWRRLAYRSLLLQRLLPFPLEEFQPYLEDTVETVGSIAERCRARGVGYLTATFAVPDASRADPDFRRHLDANAEFWTRRLPMPSFATYAAILGRYNRLLVDYAQRRHVAYVPVHEQIDDPRLFVDACHFTPEGIARLAAVFLPVVDGLIQDTRAYRARRNPRSSAVRTAAP
jgi:lysophospholipase L1-like esterase